MVTISLSSNIINHDYERSFFASFLSLFLSLSVQFEIRDFYFYFAIWCLDCAMMREMGTHAWARAHVEWKLVHTLSTDWVSWTCRHWLSRCGSSRKKLRHTLHTQKIRLNGIIQFVSVKSVEEEKKVKGRKMRSCVSSFSASRHESRAWSLQVLLCCVLFLSPIFVYRLLGAQNQLWMGEKRDI